MKVLLIEPKRTFYEEKISETDYTYPHLGLLSIAAHLEAHGHVVDYFNTRAFRDPISKIKAVCRQQYDFVGLTSTAPTLESSLAIAGVIKKKMPKAKIVLGGVNAWLNPREILKHRDIDFLIRGLGEIPFLKLIEKNKPSLISGVCYRNGTKLIISEPFFPTSAELSKIASILSYSKYEQVYRATKKLAFGNTRYLFTSFGCPFNCNYCSVPKLFPGTMLFRDIKSVLEEVKILSKRTRRILFVDPDINVNKQHFISLFSSILEAKKRGEIDKKTKFLIQARLDCFDREMLLIAKKASVIALVGVESLSQRIREFDLNKGGQLAKWTEAEVKIKIKQVEKYIRLFTYFILATPETKMADLNKNLRFIKKLKRGWYELNRYIIPFPGTNYYDKYKNSSLITYERIISGSVIKKVPSLLLCKDTTVREYISKAFESAIAKCGKNKKLHFYSVFAKALTDGDAI